MAVIVKNPYFKLLANNISLFILKKFFLEKIDSNIKANASFLHFLIQEIVNIKIDNTINYDHDISITTFFTTNTKKNYIFEIIRVRIITLINIIQVIN